MHQQSSASLILPLTSRLIALSRQHAASPNLGQVLLDAVLEHVPGLAGAALYESGKEQLFRFLSRGDTPSMAALLPHEQYPDLPASLDANQPLTLSGGDLAMPHSVFPYSSSDTEQTTGALIVTAEAPVTAEATDALQVAARLIGLSLAQQQTLLTARAVLDAPDPQTMAVYLYHSLIHPPDRLTLQHIEFDDAGEIAAIVDDIVVDSDGLHQPQDSKHVPDEEGTTPYLDALLEGDYWIVDDVPGDERFTQQARDTFIKRGIGAVAMYPLRDSEGVVRHLMFAGYYEPHHYTENEIAILHTVSQQAGVILRNWQLVDNMRDQTQRLQEQVRITQSLFEIGQSLSSELDTTDVIQQAAESLFNALDVDHVGIALYNEARSVARVVGEFPLQGGVGVEFGLIDYPVFDYMNDTLSPFIAEDIASDTRMGEAGQTLLNFGIKGVMIAPLIVNNKVVGSIGVDLMEQTRPFTEQEIRLTEAVAGQLAVSTQNAELFAQTQQQVTERTEELQASEAELASLFAAMTDVVIVYNSAGRYLRIAPTNPALLADMPETMLGKTVNEVLPSTVAAQIMHTITRTLETGQVQEVSYELPIQGQEGLRWFSATCSPLMTDQVLLVARDITEQQQLLERIEMSLDRRVREVQLTTDVAQEIAAANNLDELFERVVTLVKERFGFYHTQIFRFDPLTNTMRLVKGYGEIGEKMLAAGHHLAAGRGVVGQVATTGQSVLAANTADDPNWVPNPNLPDTKGELAVSIRLRGETLGILDVQSDTANTLSEEDLLLLEGLCGQIAVAIGATRLLEGEREQRELAETLSEISLALTAQVGSEQMLDEILSYTRRLIPGSNAASITLVDGDLLRIERWQSDEHLGSEHPPVGASMPIERFPAMQQIINSAQPQIVPDMARLAEQSIEQNVSWVQSYIALPVTLRDRVLGVIWVGSDTAGTLNQHEATRLQPLVNAAAIALDNARLLRAAETRARHEERLNQIGVELQQTSNINDLLNTALQELGENLGAHVGRIRLTLPADDAGNIISGDNGQ